MIKLKLLTINIQTMINASILVLLFEILQYLIESIISWHCELLSASIYCTCHQISGTLLINRDNMSKGMIRVLFSFLQNHEVILKCVSEQVVVSNACCGYQQKKSTLL